VQKFDELTFLGSSEYEVSLKSKVWHSTASIEAVPKLVRTNPPPMA